LKIFVVFYENDYVVECKISLMLRKLYTVFWKYGLDLKKNSN